MEQFLLQLFIFLAAAALAVPLAKKTGLGSVTGYLMAGIVIGPFGLSLIGDIEEVMHFTEFGVVMMLFLVGLELKPALLKKLLTPIVGMGGLQVVLTSLVIGIGALVFLPWQQALAAGLILSLSSSAQVLQTLKEKGITETPHGQSVFSVLLFHDLAVVPMLAVLPLLSTRPIQEDSHGSQALFDIAALPGYLQILVTVMAILAIFFLARFASRPIFRIIAATGIREIFVAAALAMIAGVSLLMYAVDLSPALGTFLAGVVMADSEYRHELESDIEPFKGLLLGIFFISIGASLNFVLIKEHILLISCLTAALISLKWIVHTIVGFIFKMKKRERSFFSMALAQGGAFAFVLFPASLSAGVLPETVIEPLISAVVISMFLTPLFFMIHERFTKTEKDHTAKHHSDTIEERGHRVIMAGFGRLGLDLGRFLISAGIKPVIIDHDASNVEILRKFGFKVYYGDITRPDLLEAAGASEAELLIITIDNLEKTEKLAEMVKKHYPNLAIAVNASDRSATYELMDRGITHIRRETFGTALELGKDALTLLGKDPYEAYRLMRIFRKHDERMLPELYRIHRRDEEGYVSMYRKHQADLEEIMSLDRETDREEADRAWNSENIGV